MRRTFTRVALAAIALVAGGPVVLPAAPDPPGVLRLGVVTDGEAERTAPIAERFHAEIRRLLEGEFTVEETRIVADWTLPGVRDALDRMLEDPDIDVVLAAGILASDEACRSTELPKPVIAPFIQFIYLALLAQSCSGRHLMSSFINNLKGGMLCKSRQK